MPVVNVVQMLVALFDLAGVSDGADELSGLDLIALLNEYVSEMSVGRKNFVFVSYADNVSVTVIVLVRACVNDLAAVDRVNLAAKLRRDFVTAEEIKIARSESCRENK